MEGISGGDLHELTAVHEASTPSDNRETILWFTEPKTEDHHVLTQHGVQNIYYHQYKAGTYTVLDNFLNPFWTALTECLPLWLAPNLVTTLGGLHCVAAYGVSWQYGPFANCPTWCVGWNGYCGFVYYTLDCMDGKQARRTQSSSPLGQLFDHGMDCLCLQQHWSMVMAVVCAPLDTMCYAAQASLLFSFYLAQWEEYYTGTLPHATGQIGVTEVNYSLAVMSMLHAVLFRTAESRQAFYSQELDFNDTLGLKVSLQQAILYGWYLFLGGLCVLSIGRVLVAARSVRRMVSALSKLMSPLLLLGAPLFLPDSILKEHFRWIALSIGLASTQMTVKVIVFSMAKQAMAALQVYDVLPLVGICYWVGNDERFEWDGIRLVFQVFSGIYLLRLLVWTNRAIRQLCERLDINLFTIKRPHYNKAA